MSDDKYIACESCSDRFYNLNGARYCHVCQKGKTALAIAEEDAKRAQFDRRRAEDSLKAMEITKTLVLTKAKRYWKQYALIWFAGWTVAGGVFALYERYSGDGKGCVYRSVSSVINPGFVLGCELLRERWEIGK